MFIKPYKTRVLCYYKEMENTEKLAQIRHSLAHLLGASILELYPGSKLTLGPAVDNGFYYDVDVAGKIHEEDLQKIEKKMREMVKSWSSFDKDVVDTYKAKTTFLDNEYKNELIDGIIEKGEEITLYTSGDFTDLCRGGHVENMGDVDMSGWKLDRVAGAYWRGDEKNKMLTRVYGLAFENKNDLDAYIARRDEAHARDHKKLGKELDLFTFSELIGPGLPLWTPRGTMVRNLLDNYVWELREKAGYEKVEIPHITKKELYEKSGHWDKFKDDLFHVTSREGHQFAMKPMNCPHHTQIFDRKPWSYKELPQRYANTTTCYRDEQSGELSGLSRLRAFTQDDAHVFCRMDQTREEFLKVFDIVQAFYKTFGFELRVRISKHDPENFHNYIGDKEKWILAEQTLTDLALEKGVDTFEGIGEAAFYGPKLDFMAKDAIGREWQVATIQLDMNMPERFDLNCTNEKGEKERIVMIHAAIMGSIDRFMSVLIEHIAGKFPTWLSPVQVAIIPVRENHDEAGTQLMQTLKNKFIRVEKITGNESLGKRIHHAKKYNTPYIIVLGDKEIESGMLAIEKIDGSKIQMSIDEFTEHLEKEIKSRN
jgi:threonyl-tRNA synthetase